jgi:uncharacterized phage protein (TIGR02218 family)
MSFNARETSTESGQPIRCYRFVFEDGSRDFGFTSAPNLTTLIPIAGALMFLPVAIKDDGLRSTGDKIADTMTITAPSDIEPAQWFVRSPPTRTVRVIIYDKHHADDEFLVTYTGEVREVSFDEIGQCKFICGAIGDSMDREGLRLCWERTCTHTIYDDECKLIAAFFGVDVFVMSLTADSVQVDGLAGQPDGKFNGGFLQFQHPVKGQLYKTIRKHVGSTLSIFEGTTDIFAGTQIRVYPGCDHTPATCQSFGNYNNYGGVPSLPGKSPFDGNPVF